MAWQTTGRPHGVRLVHDRQDLLPPCTGAAAVPLARAHAAGGGDLDEVGARPDDFADLRSGLDRARAFR